MEKVGISKLLLAVFKALLAAVIFVFSIGLRDGYAPWQLEFDHFVATILFAAGLFVAILASSSNIFKSRSQLWSLIRALSIGALISAPIFALLLIMRDGVSGLPILEVEKYTVVALFSFFYCLLLLNNFRISEKYLILANLVLLGLVVSPTLKHESRSKFLAILSGNEAIYDESVAYKFSSLYDLKLTDYPIADWQFNKGNNGGGGLSRVSDDRILLVTGLGEIYLIRVDEELTILPEKYSVTPFKRNHPRIRVTDAMLESSDEDTRSLFVSYEHWDTDHNCVTLNLAEASVNVAAFGREELKWKVRFSTSPCVKGPYDITTGGRIAQFGESALLLSVGTMVHAEYWQYDALKDSPYGKIIELNRADWRAQVFSSGHRNPQGLLVLEGEIWATEHGPDGGDELNLIEYGKNYGFPESSYGTRYGQKTWFGNGKRGEHFLGQRPAFAWVPSVGISNLIRIQGAAFENWKGDLLVASLAGKGNGRSVFRVKLFDGAVQYVEPIRTGRLVRDLIELQDGRIILWDGQQNLQLMEPERTAFSSCSGCHALRNDTHGIGPDLMAVVDKKVARWEDFPYSEAMRKFGGRWTRARLLSFIENPNQVVPGTIMNFSGIADPEQREAIVDYIEAIRREN
jgi:cytochrome c2